MEDLKKLLRISRSQRDGKKSVKRLEIPSKTVQQKEREGVGGASAEGAVFHQTQVGVMPVPWSSPGSEGAGLRDGWEAELTELKVEGCIRADSQISGLRNWVEEFHLLRWQRLGENSFGRMNKSSVLNKTHVLICWDDPLLHHGGGDIRAGP